MFSDLRLAGSGSPRWNRQSSSRNSTSARPSPSQLPVKTKPNRLLLEKLSSMLETEQCSWRKDKYGLSRQIVLDNMAKLAFKPGAYAKMMQMNKLVIADF